MPVDKPSDTAIHDSVLWKSGGQSSDERLLDKLFKKIVPGDGEHRKMCIKDSLVTIQKPEWQSIYTNVTFVHSIAESHTRGLHIETKFTLCAQALELIYYCIAEDLDAFDQKLSYDRKLKVVFKAIYGWKIPNETANLIRILRNDVMHTGSMSGVGSSQQFITQIATINKKYPDYLTGLSDARKRFHIIADFWHLVDDMLVRILGLNSEKHLNQNGAPAWQNPIFGYEHGKTSTKLL